MYTPRVISLPRLLERQIADRGRGLTLLVVRLGALGDVLRTVPPARLLRRSLEAARIFWVVDERWEPVLRDHRDLDGILAAPRSEWERLSRTPAGWIALLRSVAGFAARLRSVRAGLAIDFHGNLRSGILAWLSRAPVRLGYAGHQQKEGNRLLTTHRVPSGPRRTPRMERNLDLVRSLGLPDSPLPDGGLALVERGREPAGRVIGSLLARGQPYAVLSPGASARQSYKKPPPALLAAAADALFAREILPLVVHGPGEEADARSVVESSRGHAHLAPPTDLATLAALIEEARVLVAGDTGPLHLACAVGCPVVGIYGPTDPIVNSPWGVTHAEVCPVGRRYTGIKRIDRRAGGFEGIDAAAIGVAIERVLDEAGRVASARS